MAFAVNSFARFGLFLLFPLLFSCRANAGSGDRAGPGYFPETFESGHKAAYAAGDVALSTGLWQLNGSLIGSSEQDVKAGTSALRLKGGGTASMLFDIHTDIKAVRFKYALFGKDKHAALSLWYTTDSGGHWQQKGPGLNVYVGGMTAITVAL